MADRPDPVRNRRVGRIQPDRHVAASDIEPDAGNADLPLIGNDAADYKWNQADPGIPDEPGNTGQGPHQ